MNLTRETKITITPQPFEFDEPLFRFRIEFDDPDVAHDFCRILNGNRVCANGELSLCGRNVNIGVRASKLPSLGLRLAIARRRAEKYVLHDNSIEMSRIETTDGCTMRSHTTYWPKGSFLDVNR